MDVAKMFNLPWFCRPVPHQCWFWREVRAAQRLKMSRRGGPELAVFRRGYGVLIHVDRGPEFGRSCETRRRRFFFLKNRRFWLKENGGGDFWTADNKKVEKTKSMKKSAPPPQGRDAFFWKMLRFFSKRNTQRAAHATRTRNTQHAHATRNTHTQHATRKNHPKSPFQGLEPLSQVLNKLGRNKKLNPSLANRVMGRCQTLKK